MTEEIEGPETLVDAETDFHKEAKKNEPSSLDAFMNERIWGDPGLRWEEREEKADFAVEVYQLAISDVMAILNNDATTMYSPVLQDIEDLLD